MLDPSCRHSPSSLWRTSGWRNPSLIALRVSSVLEDFGSPQLIEGICPAERAINVNVYTDLDLKEENIWVVANLQINNFFILSLQFFLCYIICLHTLFLCLPRISDSPSGALRCSGSVAYHLAAVTGRNLCTIETLLVRHCDRNRVDLDATLMDAPATLNGVRSVR